MVLSLRKGQQFSSQQAAASQQQGLDWATSSQPASQPASSCWLLWLQL